VEDGEARAGAFCLEGARTHERYVERAEHERLAAVEPQLSRPDSSRAVLIPLSKSEEWWELAQDERRHMLTYLLLISSVVATALRHKGSTRL
jgi:hypothetical protein